MCRLLLVVVVVVVVVDVVALLLLPCQVIRPRSKVVCTMTLPRHSLSHDGTAPTSPGEAAVWLETELRSRLRLNWTLQGTRTGHARVPPTATVSGE